ncbi:hypothetical protein LAY57_10395 [Argonema antarcticum A004/B2]|nr:hypothetical protein [Argonema antarcticum]MCL1471081.1 hypothetical protein [Argonema antarcticum A004/B2]
MSLQASLPKVEVQQVIERILALRQISRADQRLLMSALLSQNSLSDIDESQIKRIFDALQKGMLRVVD